MVGPAAVQPAPSTEPTVFVSYSSTDRKALPPLLEALERAGYSVWWDGMIGGGEVFASSIEAPLSSARAVIVLWSKSAVASHWVRDEAGVARDSQRLVPLTLDGTPPPLGFRQVQTIDFSHGRAEAIAAMLRAVAALHDGERLPTPAAAAPARGALLSRRTALIGGIAAVGAAGAAGAWHWDLLDWNRPGGAAETDNSLAVLPFDNLSGSAEQAYFSDGLAAELRTELAANPLLRVVAQTSSNSFRDSTEDARTITRALGVRFLLDGSVRRAGDRMRVSAELIEGATGFSRWSQTFERPVDNVFAVQSEIAGTVTLELTRSLVDNGAGPQVGTDDLQAYDFYLRGRDLYNRAAEQEDDMAALAMFDRAIEADPSYAAAHAARARSLTVIGNQYDQGATRRARYETAIAAARRAVALRADSAETQSALGFALFNGTIDAQAARVPFERSRDLGQGNADVLARYALYSARCGRATEARSAIAKAVALDPLNARVFRQKGDIEYAARAYAASIPPLEQALALNPQLSVVHAAIGSSQLMLGEPAAARAAFAREPSSLFGLTGLAIIDARLGGTARRDRPADRSAERRRADHRAGRRSAARSPRHVRA